MKRHLLEAAAYNDAMSFEKEKDQNSQRLEPGETFAGRFLLIKRLGTGASSIVFEAREQLLERKLAIKVLQIESDPSDKDSEKQTTRFRKEAQRLAALNHTNIVRIFAFGQASEGQAFLAMELLEGITLCELLKEEGSLSVEKFDLIFSQVIEALKYVHGQNIIHRDIKPSNIMILLAANSMLQMQVKLMDFGIARVLEAPGSEASTQTRSVSGTPAYMSPEQCLAKDCDARSDLYSLACVMYEAVSGKPPFVSESSAATMYEHLHKEPVRLISGELAHNYSQAALDLMLRALSKDPNDRPASMTEFQGLLEKALSTRESGTIPSLLQLDHQKKMLVFCFMTFFLAAAALLALRLTPFWEPDSRKEVAAASTKELQEERRIKNMSIAEAIEESLRLQNANKLQAALDLLLAKLHSLKAEPANTVLWRDMHNKIGSAYLKLTEYGKAEKYLDKGYEISKQNNFKLDISFLRDYCTCMLKRGREKEAFDLLDHLIAGANERRKIEPDLYDPEVLANLYHLWGIMLYEQKNFAAARAKFKGSLDLFDTCPCRRSCLPAVETLIFYLISSAEASPGKQIADFDMQLARASADLLGDKCEKDKSYPYALVRYGAYLAGLGRQKEAKKYFSLASESAQAYDSQIRNEQVEKWRAQAQASN